MAFLIFMSLPKSVFWGEMGEWKTSKGVTLELTVKLFYLRYLYLTWFSYAGIIWLVLERRTDVEQVKVFHGVYSRVEKEVNEWIEERHSDTKTSAFKITRVLQSSHGSCDVTISIFYKQEQAQR